MRVLLLTTFLSGGGAAVACRRTREALELCGAEVRVLQLTSSDSDTHTDEYVEAVATPLGAKLTQALERLNILWHNGWSRQHLFRYSSARYGQSLIRHPWVQWAEVIHLHWINHGLLSLRGVRELISLGKPTLWSLHDMWPILGGCHLPFLLHNESLEPCPRIGEGCGVCPLLSSHRMEDLSRQLIRHKESWWQRHVHLICVSQAEARLVERIRESRSLPQASVLPNPINLDHFCMRPVPKGRLPEWYRSDRHYLLLVASRLDDKVKGPHLLHETLEHFCLIDPERAKQTSLLLVGHEKVSETLATLPIATIRLGSIHDEEHLIDLYNLCDIVLSTSLYETFGQTLSEGTACGAMAICFCSEGPEDIIIPSANGDLIPAYDTEAMARSISYRLSPEGRIPRSTCRATANRFGYSQVGRALLALYQQLTSI